MKIYRVCLWAGQYEQYSEYEEKFFLIKESAEAYKCRLENENHYDKEFECGGVIFDEKELIEDYFIPHEDN